MIFLVEATGVDSELMLIDTGVFMKSWFREGILLWVVEIELPFVLLPAMLLLKEELLFPPAP